MQGFYAHLSFFLALYFQKIPPYTLNNKYIYFYQQTLFIMGIEMKNPVFMLRPQGVVLLRFLVFNLFYNHFSFFFAFHKGDISGLFA